MALQPGDIIGPYRIEQLLGIGAMGVVYKAYHTKLAQYRALKIIHPLFAQDSHFLERFQREARLTAQLDHPNIVTIHDYNTYDGQLLLVMQFIQGMTLADIIKDVPVEGPLWPEDILQVMSAVASALTFAHAQGILHRDVKPSNILLDKTGKPYLTDFGLARLAQAGSSSVSQDRVIGTPFYISPEQAQGSQNLDGRTDVYSLGVVLYQLVTGDVPFTADSATAIMYHHIHTPPPFPREINPDIPVALEQVLLRALAKDPQDRFATPNALVAAYRQAMMGEGVSVLDRPKNNLPAQTTPFVGRERELHDLMHLLADPEVRLITILAPGGMG